MLGLDRLWGKLRRDSIRKVWFDYRSFYFVELCCRPMYDGSGHGYYILLKNWLLVPVTICATRYG